MPLSQSSVDDHRYVLAVDLGTSGCKTALVSRSGRVAAWAFKAVSTQLLPGGGAEQQPQDWWQAFIETARQVLSKSGVPAQQVVAVCCSTQGEGTIAVDKNGEVLHPALTWMDMRGGALLRARSRGLLNVAGYSAYKLQRWLRLCGGAPSLSGKDPAAHMLWIRKRLPEVYANTYKFLNVLDYLNLRLTGRFVATSDSILTSWVTDNRDPSNIRYDAGLVRTSEIDADKFPELVKCTDVIGTLLPRVAEELGLPAATPVVAGSIDNTAAAIGAGTYDDFDAHLYIGTSSWIGAHVPRKKTDVQASIASLPCARPDKYLMVAMQTSAGSNLSFLKEKVLYHQDELLREAAAKDVYQIIDQIAARVPAGSEGLLYTPWLHGERCPVDERALRAGLFNLSLSHSREHIIRAFLEGVALNTRWMMQPVERFLGRKTQRLTMLGGGGSSGVWCQIFADVLGMPIRQLEEPLQANAIGAAMIAFTGLGELDFETAARQTRYRQIFEPQRAHQAVYDGSFETFLELYRRLKPLYQRINPMQVVA
ncbi:MAG TPA: FGGY-family carbohydrate kinase [Burkholderiaceae bacterium]